MATTAQRQAAARQAKREAAQAVKHVNACKMLTQAAKELCEAGRFSEVIAHQVVEVSLHRAGPMNFKFVSCLVNAPLVGMTRDEFVKFAKTCSDAADDDFSNNYFERGTKWPYMVSMFMHVDGVEQQRAHHCRSSQLPTEATVEDMVLTMPTVAMLNVLNDDSRKQLMNEMMGSF